MPRLSRRGLLWSGGVAAACSFAGCTGRLAGTTETPGQWPERHTDEADPVRWRLRHDDGASFGPALTDDGIVVAWGHYFEYDGSVSSVAAPSGTVDWHRNVSIPPYRPPIVHGDGVYLLTGVKSGHVRNRQRLRRFGPDGSEQWRTEQKGGLLDLLAVGDGRAFLGEKTRNLGADSRGLSLFAVSLADGTQDWTRKVPSNSAGIYHGGRLLVESDHDSVGSFVPADGTEQWRADGQMLTDARDVPTLANNVAYVRRREGIAAVDLQDGNEVWQETEDRYGWAGVVGQETLVVSPVADLVYGLDPADGTERWRLETDAPATPSLLADGTVFVNDERSLRAIDAATGERLWRTDSAESVRDSGRGMVVTVGEAESGVEIVAREVEDGTERWRYEAPDVNGITVGQWHTYASLGDEGLVALGT